MRLVELLGLWRSRVAEVLKKDVSLYISTAEQMLKLGEPLMAYDVLVEGLRVSKTDVRLRQLQALALLRAGVTDEAVIPMAAWDGRAGSPGGTGTTVERWRDFGLQIEVIDLAQILQAAGRNKPAASNQPSDPHTAERSSPDIVPEIRSLLFADALHFSKLTEDQIPLFLNHFLGTIAGLLARTSYQPLMRNTWGDGLFMVFRDVHEAGAFALELCDLINQTKWEEKLLPKEMNLRIALHAGPVFECVDPISERQNFFGTHVSRAARIEPARAGVCKPGFRSFGRRRKKPGLCLRLCRSSATSQGLWYLPDLSRSS